MTEYSRPHIEPTVCRDVSGSVIDYGNRWQDNNGSPPESSYSVVTHPERYAPLHTVATALIDYLVSAYDVNVEEGIGVNAGLRNSLPAEKIVRAVRLAPDNAACPPLTIALTDFPGVQLHAGALFENVYPFCGCDACDDTWDYFADELEQDTLAIVGGRFTESVNVPRRTASYHFATPDGEFWKSGEGSTSDLPKPLLRIARARLDVVAAASPAGNWLPWPARADPVL